MIRVRAATVALLLLGGAGSAWGRTQSRFGVAVGAVLPHDLRVDGQRHQVGPGPLVLLTVDHPLGAALDAGVFVHAGALTADHGLERVSLFEAGLGLHWVNSMSWGVLRLGGGVGVRRLFADLVRYDRVYGVVVDADAEIAFPLVGELAGQVEAGVLAQPFGSNGSHRVEWAPFPYLAVGVSL